MSHDLCDLEIHPYPHTVPFKVRAKRRSVFQLDSGLGKGAEHLYLDERHRDIVKGAGRLSNQALQATRNRPTTGSVVSATWS